MSNIKLAAQTRKKENKKTEGKIPAVIYGPNSKNRSLELDYKNFSEAYRQAGESSLIDLAVDDKSAVKVLIQDIQKDPLSEKYVHIDFYELDMNKKLSLEVELKFEGIEEVEKATAGEVIRNMDKLEVECLPKDLIKEITVDIQEFLKELGDTMHAKDIKLPEGLSLVGDDEAPLISVQEIKEEIIEAQLAEEEAAEGEEKKEEAEGEEDEKKAEDKAQEGGIEAKDKTEEKK